jgi:hypothetical protein
MLCQPVPPLNLPALDWLQATNAQIKERAELLLYGIVCPRGDEHMRALAIVVGSLPGSEEEIYELEKAGY